jgi:ribosome-associated translation inhibitor RaiA
MSKTESIVRSLELKFDKILKKFDQLENNNLILKKELDLLRQKKSDLDIKLKNRESDLEALKIASSMLGSNDDKRASKLKINALIRDINDCIASLSD